jgi:hypothetical protein
MAPVVPVFSRVSLRQQTETWSEGRLATTGKYFSRLNIKLISPLQCRTFLSSLLQQNPPFALIAALRL